MRGLTRNVALNREEAEALVNLTLGALGLRPCDGHDVIDGSGGAVKVAEAFGMDGDSVRLLSDLVICNPDRAQPGDPS